MPKQPLVLLFPGQASQYVGMGKDLYDNSQAARILLDRITAKDEFKHLPQLCFEGPADILTRTDNVQPAITLISLMALEAIREKIPQQPIACAGHSLGEYAAHAAAGNLDYDLTMELVRWRGYWMNEASQPPNPTGSMVAIIGLKPDKCFEISEELGSDKIAVANLNSPGQIILSGLAETVEQASKMAKEAGAKKTVMLNVSGAWHSPLMQPAEEKMKELLSQRINEQTQVNPEIAVPANATGEAVRDAADLRDTLTRQITSPVLWQDCVMSLLKTSRYPGLPGNLDAETRESLTPPLFVEVGPNKVLKGLMRGIDKKLTVLNVEDVSSLQILKEKI